ncbi:hypothetical protein [Alkalinema sp. FACHB-956]|uniref:hypothetical protein n=1 Tax=Alkalinema sp. FACHB-956 TaxID=2692768 RepID=UPI001689F3CB|nr:hypothetical protein [Alkalinema sp. FACHB-956]MBD2329184.1 hypothetical protein [Alkalinema sp. FACHB-956]
MSQSVMTQDWTQKISQEQAMVFSELGDRLFNELASRMATRHQYRLLFEHTLQPELFQQIRIAAAGYISACLNSPIILSEQEMIERLLEAREQNLLPNYLGTGLLVPKKEHILAFNLLQKSVADAFFQLGANDLIDAVDLPVNLRMVYGKTSAEVLKLPFTSMKRHSDVWNGVHPDATVVVLPLFGDIDNITIEAGEMPRDMELPAMRLMSDFNDGRDIPMVVSYDEAKMQHGTMYFNDARGLHQTVRRVSHGLRISIDFRFRRKFNEPYRSMILPEAMKRPSTGNFEQDMCVPYEDWLKVGRETMLIFDETMEESRLRRQVGDVPLYIRDYRLLSLNNA